MASALDEDMNESAAGYCKAACCEYAAHLVSGQWATTCPCACHGANVTCPEDCPCRSLDRKIMEHRVYEIRWSIRGILFGCAAFAFTAGFIRSVWDLVLVTLGIRRKREWRFGEIQARVHRNLHRVAHFVLWIMPGETVRERFESKAASIAFHRHWLVRKDTTSCDECYNHVVGLE